MVDSDMTRAKTALERLSKDPAARELARERELAAWNYERTLKLARQEGIQEGIEEGLVRGRSELLVKQLSLKFGPLSEQLVQRVLGASAHEAERWAERVLTASSIDEVLDLPLP